MKPRNCPVCGRDEKYIEEPGDFGTVIGGEWVHKDDGSMECEVVDGDAEKIVEFLHKNLDDLQAKVSEIEALLDNYWGLAYTRMRNEIRIILAKATPDEGGTK